ncbi:MAG TPA: SGNH/GDSL hydrolase family protein [Oscillospiraceae bacterium]|nr:SGNH/GDSL hydrolase family protein [Oscillospiraceae bacterium]HPF56738.1 SGNH/GDSL hydrolase family protein [Clostridiales bacterium]HPK35145.1 SGNH/GDSL hydrolase family protein [Oscillospiraceae bacterium]HPR74948.1 SGNH/GDSL hydrolase family protein [Oscillospiraceae bacterium]
MKKIDIFGAPVVLHGFDAEGVKKLWRLPFALHDQVNLGVATLCKHTSGGRIRFCTDSKKLSVRVTVTEDCLFPHMPLSGSSGVDLFVNGRFVQNWRPDLNRRVFSFEYNMSGEKNEICFYLPLYNGVEAFELYADDGAFIGAPRPYTHQKPVVFYGSSITQGACASRPSNNYVAEVCEIVDADFRNLGFSGNALGEENIADYIAGLDMSVFVLDYDHNSWTERLDETHERFFKQVRAKNPTLPIIMMTRPDFDANIPDSTRRREIVKRTYDNAVASGDKFVAFLDGETFFGNVLRDHCTPDTCHPTDLGFERMAMAVLPALKKFLS